MIKIIYTVASEKKDSEIKWLRMQGIYPATQDDLHWPLDQKDPKFITRFGVITDNDAALAIKLRHNLNLQTNYRQK